MKMNNNSGGGTSARLVAYIVKNITIRIIDHNDDIVINTKELREFIKEKLPEYMIPSTFVILDQLPLTPNGKVDRKSLPEPDQRPDDFSKYVAPRTTIEQHLVEIWKQLLGLQQVGIYDNFFELGGHSLLATQLVSRIKRQEGIEIPLKFIFESPTIADIGQFFVKSNNKKKKQLSTKKNIK